MDERSVDQATLARATGITPSAIQNYRNGRIPKSDELFKLSQFFAVSMESLLGIDTSAPVLAAKALADQHVGSGEEKQRVFEKALQDLGIWQNKAFRYEVELADTADTLEGLASKLRRLVPYPDRARAIISGLKELERESAIAAEEPLPCGSKRKRKKK